jgi:hypothetical protein
MLERKFSFSNKVLTLETDTLGKTSFETLHLSWISEKKNELE